MNSDQLVKACAKVQVLISAHGTIRRVIDTLPKGDKRAQRLGNLLTSLATRAADTILDSQEEFKL